MKSLLVKSIGIAVFLTAAVWSAILGYHNTAFTAVKTIAWQYLAFFVLAAAICMSIVLLVSRKNFDQTGMSFLAVTTVKMIPAFVVIKFAREQVDETLAIQMGYSGFLLFLAIEVYFTYRLLNNKQKKD
ncbi:hypothetical protein [Flavobacterium aurantiibacter]|uniref:Uncharacterized protein n=1 Tax=Flavobacterium aurantiibacter TaxID=2023067 RepID=A0A255ZX69_9FLAO|nr:hypothetical protein [Flavobacterium aurantiibacter]OYQ45982.1 hypothetical protein CHX27_05315 [Flavobacterium aurantiibacter]